MLVTRIAYSNNLNAGKLAILAEQARRLGRVRSLVWQRYGSVGSAQLRDREVRDRWLVDGSAAAFGVLANAWKETLRDAMGDIRANRESAKVGVRRAVHRRTRDEAERRRLFGLLKADRWAGDPFLSRLMRQHWRRGKNRTHNQIVVRSDRYRCYTLTDQGNVWLAVPGLGRREMVRIPLDTTALPTGTLRLVLRGGRVEIHYQVDAAGMRSSRPCGDRRVGVDKGYTEVLVDSDGVRHGPGLGDLLRTESDRLKVKNARRARLRWVAEKAEAVGDTAKARRITRNNLGTAKRATARCRFEGNARTLTYRAVHAVLDKAGVVVAEDLTRPFAGKSRGRDMNRRLAAWTKGLTAKALHDVSERRGSALVHVNAAYTSQVDAWTGRFGVRKGDRLHRPGGVVLDADVNAAVNILHRHGDPDITLWTPYTRVKQILRERDRHRIRLPILDSSPPGGERTIRSCPHTERCEQ